MTDPLPSPAPNPLPPPDPTSEVADDEVAGLDTAPVNGPAVGQLSAGWRLVTALTWVGVILALAAVWNTSVQLGLSTWWLGPRAQPRSRVIQFSPFVAPLLMVLGAINQARWLAWFGVAAAGVIVGYGIGDLSSAAPVAGLEIAIGLAAAAVSLASLTGTYRRDTRNDDSSEE